MMTVTKLSNLQSVHNVGEQFHSVFETSFSAKGRNLIFIVQRSIASAIMKQSVEFPFNFYSKY